jgi:hypothetical protein
MDISLSGRIFSDMGFVWIYATIQMIVPRFHTPHGTQFSTILIIPMKNAMPWMTINRQRG